MAMALLAGCSPSDDGANGNPTGRGQDQERNSDFANSEAEVLAYQTAIRDCLTDGGFPAEIQPDGGVVIDIPPGQDEAFMHVDAACRERIPEPASRVLTEQEVNAKYELEVESAECLAAAGYPEIDMESREVWVAQWMAVDAGASDVPPDTAWSQIAGNEAEEAQQVCPMPTVQDIYQRLNGG
ncbi:MAG TPA: hypothetical protein VK045_09315 [Ornithinicoccus sp.]|nr:hypothetical protein [Ornithinicoccus sp.]